MLRKVKTEELGALSMAFRAMGTVERELWIELGARILQGQEQYGKLSINKKNWPQELYEELLDSSFYAMMELIRLRRHGRKTKTRKTVEHGQAQPTRGRIRKMGP